MIHDLNIFHAQQFDSLFHDSACVSSATIIDLDEIFMISIEPFAFASVDFHDFDIEGIDFFFEFFDSILIMTLLVGEFFYGLFLIFFYFFDLIIDVGLMMDVVLID